MRAGREAGVSCVRGGGKAMGMPMVPNVDNLLRNKEFTDFRRWPPVAAPGRMYHARPKISNCYTAGTAARTRRGRERSAKSRLLLPPRRRVIPNPQKQWLWRITVILRKAPTPNRRQRAAARATTEGSLSATGGVSHAKASRSRRDGAQRRDSSVGARLSSGMESFAWRLPQDDTVCRIRITTLLRIRYETSWFPGLDR
jgi:hypothetical protein